MLALVRAPALVLCKVLPLLPCALLSLMGPTPVLALGLMLVLLRVLLLCLRVPGASLCVVCPLLARGGTLYAVCQRVLGVTLGVLCLCVLGVRLCVVCPRAGTLGVGCLLLAKGGPRCVVSLPFGRKGRCVWCASFWQGG